MIALLVPPSSVLTRPRALAALAEGCALAGVGRASSGAEIPLFPPRAPDTVVGALLSDAPTRLMELWLLIANHSFWANQNLEMVVRVAEKLNRAPRSRATLQWRIALALSGQAEKCASQLVHAAQLDWPLDALRSRNTVAVATRGMKTNTTPREIFRAARLPSELPFVYEALAEAVQIFVREGDRTREDWVIRCLEALSPTLCDRATEVLLQGLPSAEAEHLPRLRAWVLARYGGQARETRIEYLAPPIHRHIDEWSGSLQFQDFIQVAKTLVEILAGPQDPEVFLHHALNAPREDLKADEWPIRQMYRRMGFWSNYSTRVRRARFLVPTRVGRGLQERGLATASNLMIGTFAEETAILDLETVVVIVTFRGRQPVLLLRPGRETHFLFSSGQLREADVRELQGWEQPQGDYWQNHLYWRLRESYGVTPNGGIGTHRPFRGCATDPDSGLPRRPEAIGGRAGPPRPSDVRPRGPSARPAQHPPVHSARNEARVTSRGPEVVVRRRTKVHDDE